MKRKRHRKHWYFQWFHECPVCGYEDKGRERRYGRKPKDPDKLYEFSQLGCAGGTCWSLC